VTRRDARTRSITGRTDRRTDRCATQYAAPS